MTTAVPSLPTTTPAACVGDAHRGVQIRAGAEQRAERGDDGVAGAGDVVDLARDRRNVVGAVRRVEAHPLLRARDEQRRRRRAAARSACAFAVISASSRQRPTTLPELAAIGRDHRRAAILVPVVALRIDEHRLSRGARALDHRRDVREPALAVIGEDQEIGVGEQPVEVGELGREHLVRRRGLEIDAQQLLLAADDAQLDRRGQRRVAMERRLHAVGGEQPLERCAGLVGAGDGQERRRARRAPRRCARRWPRRRAALRCGRSSRPAPALPAKSARRRRTSSDRASRRRRPACACAPRGRATSRIGTLASSDECMPARP